jgi:hypothetical protein
MISWTASGRLAHMQSIPFTGKRQKAVWTPMVSKHMKKVAKKL